MRGDGADAIVTQEQIDGLEAFLDELYEVAGQDLKDAIDRERARLDLDAWVGITMDAALERLDRLTCTGYEKTLFCGELTGDCRILATDALFGLQMAVSSRPVDPAADMDGNGTISASDALKILRIAVAIDPSSTQCNA